LPEVPVRDVVALVAKDGDVREETGGEVDPLLIDEEPARGVDHALKLEPLLPPGQEAGQGRPPRDGQEPEVVGACLKDRPFAGVFVPFDGAGQVRSQSQEGLGRGGVELGQPAVEENVGVEVDDPVEAALEEMLERPRLHGRVELEDGVAEAELPRVGQRERRERHGGEPLLLDVGRGPLAEEQDEPLPLRMLLLHRGHEHPGVVPVVGRNDREDSGLHAGGSAEPGQARRDGNGRVPQSRAGWKTLVSGITAVSVIETDTY
jgi:hypothetical protein